jgi:hypothetical protein
MQHSVTRYLGKKKRGESDHTQDSRQKAAPAAPHGQRPSSKLVQILNSQLVRRDPPGGAQPGPASQVQAAAAALCGAPHAQPAPRGGQRVGQAEQRTAPDSRASSSSTAAALHHQPKAWQQEQQHHGGRREQPCSANEAPAGGPAVAGITAAESRACPLCGQHLPLDGFEEHVQQELAALEEEADATAADAAGMDSCAAQVL